MARSSWFHICQFILLLNSFYIIFFFLLQILKDRIYTSMARNLMLWNSMPGAHFIMPEYSDAAITYPFYYRQLGREPSSQFTAIIYVVTPVASSSSPLFRLVRNVAKSAYVHKVRAMSFFHLLYCIACLLSNHVAMWFTVQSCLMTS